MPGNSTAAALSAAARPANTNPAAQVQRRGRTVLSMLDP
jgi:hypothetical protein